MLRKSAKVPSEAYVILLKGDSMNLTLIDNYVVESFFF